MFHVQEGVYGFRDQTGRTCLVTDGYDDLGNFRDWLQAYNLHAEFFAANTTETAAALRGLNKHHFRPTIAVVRV